MGGDTFLKDKAEESKEKEVAWVPQKPTLCPTFAWLSQQKRKKEQEDTGQPVG